MDEKYLKAFGGLVCSVCLQLTTEIEFSIIKDVCASIAQLTIAGLTILTIYKTLKDKKRK